MHALHKCTIAIVVITVSARQAPLSRSPKRSSGLSVTCDRIVLPNTAGSAMDMVTHMMSQRFTEVWGQQVVVDNRPGAGGIVGLEITAKAAPDGYTIVFSSSAGLVIQPLLTKVPYDTPTDSDA